MFPHILEVAVLGTNGAGGAGGARLALVAHHAHVIAAHTVVRVAVAHEAAVRRAYPFPAKNEKKSWEQILCWALL